MYCSNSSPWDDEKYYSSSRDTSDAEGCGLEEEFMLYDGVMMNRSSDHEVNLSCNSDNDSNSSHVSCDLAKNSRIEYENPRIKRKDAVTKREEKKLKKKRKEKRINGNDNDQLTISRSSKKVVTLLCEEKKPTEIINLISSDDTDIEVIKVIRNPNTINKLPVKKPTHIFFPDYSDESNVDLNFPTDISTNVKAPVTRYDNEDSYEPPKKKRTTKRNSNTVLTPEEAMRKFYDSDDSDFSIEINQDANSITNTNWTIDRVDSMDTGPNRKRYYQKPIIPVVCYNCHQRGHLGNSCPDPKRIPHCHLCGGAYHKATNCKSQMCPRCLRPGHDFRHCRVSSQVLNRRCARCSVKGHEENYCPDLWRRYYLTTKDGEIKRGLGKKNPRMYCYNCTSERHWGYKCPKRRMDHHLNATNPFIISYDDAKSNVKYEESEMTHQIRISNETAEQNLVALKWKKKPRRKRREVSKRIKERKREEKNKRAEALRREEKQERNRFAETFLHSVKNKLRREKLKSLAKVKNIKQKIIDRIHKKVNF